MNHAVLVARLFCCQQTQKNTSDTPSDALPFLEQTVPYLEHYIPVEECSFAKLVVLVLKSCRFVRLDVSKVPCLGSLYFRDSRREPRDCAPWNPGLVIHLRTVHFPLQFPPHMSRILCGGGDIWDQVHCKEFHKIWRFWGRLCAFVDQNTKYFAKSSYIYH